MKHTLYYLLFLLFPFSVLAQSGFSKTILYPDSKSCTIAAVTVDQDTIVCYGDLYGTVEQKWGVYLAKFDSLGNFLQITTDFDSIYDQTVNPYSQILRTSDGGYIGVGSQGVGNKTAAYKFSHTGELEWTHFYRESNFQVVITNSIQELSDGYLCFGRYAVDYDNSNFTMKLSKAGDLLWFSKEISVFGYNDVTSGRVIKRGINYVVGSGLGPININESWSKTALIEVDSNGQVVWDWYGEIASKESGVTCLVLAPNGNIVIAVNRYFTNALNGLSAKLKFRCVQPETGNTVWQTELPSFDLDFSNSLISQVRASPNGSGFDAVGFHIHWYDGYIIQGLLTHFDWNGNLLWQRYDTVHVDTVLLVSENKLYNMAHLSSGSIIGAGQIKRSDPYGHLESWLIKWSANGCLEDGDCATVSTHDNPSGQGFPKWEVYPNPAQEGHTWLYQPENTYFNQINVQISNTAGQVVRNLSYDGASNNAYKIPLEGLRDGLYFYQVLADGLVRQSGRLVVLN